MPIRQALQSPRKTGLTQSVAVRAIEQALNPPGAEEVLTSVVRSAEIRSMDADRRIVYAIAYEPMVLDTWGEYMTPEGVEELAHRFLSLDLSQVVDVNHDNTPRDVSVVESFIARKGQTDYPEGAWVVGMRVNADDLWDKVKSGELNGFSIEALVRKRAHVVELEMTPDMIGVTDKRADHNHLFVVILDDEGRVVEGRTTTDAGHSHIIRAATHTEQAAGHNHRLWTNTE